MKVYYSKEMRAFASTPASTMIDGHVRDCVALVPALLAEVYALHEEVKRLEAESEKQYSDWARADKAREAAENRVAELEAECEDWSRKFDEIYTEDPAADAHNKARAALALAEEHCAILKEVVRVLGEAGTGRVVVDVATHDRTVERVNSTEDWQALSRRVQGEEVENDD